MEARYFVLAVGTTFAVTLPRYSRFKRLADMVGRTLARVGLGLVTGNVPGVDKTAAHAFWAECRRLGRNPEERYRQLWLPHFRRGYWLPGKAFPAPPECIVRLADSDDWIEEAIGLAGAAVMIGGRSGSLTIARRFIDAGKPVLPVPFAGGESRNVFHEILRTWADAPVPGLSQMQFLRLDVPWIDATGPLTNLLLGTLADTADIFISYRRADTGMAAGRLRADLVEHFGARRVFMDMHGILPSADWRQTIDEAIDACKVAVVVIGPAFMSGGTQGEPRLLDEDDVVRHELTELLSRHKKILPVLIDNAELPELNALPSELHGLLKYQAPRLNNMNWVDMMNLMIRAIEAAIEPGRHAAEDNTV